MLVKTEVSMELKEHKAYVRRKKSKKEEQDESTPSHQRHFAVEDELPKKLVKLELDVAEALAEFWRIAHLPKPQKPRAEFVAGLQWLGKRKRTVRTDKDAVDPSAREEEEPEDAFSSAKKSRSSGVLQRDSSTSDRDEIESTRMPKACRESFPFESRAESPSSPLPSEQLPCRTFLVAGSPASKSAFQRVLPLPLKKPCQFSVKTEIEDSHLQSFVVRPQKEAVRRKQKAWETSVISVKAEPLDEQALYRQDSKCAPMSELILGDQGVKSLAIVATELMEVHQEARVAAMNKLKSTQSEKEKEARRLRRIHANRESARQTIRRKQILCEELTKKAATLTLENEGMKQKREILLKELFSLKGQNYHLKQQLETGSSGNSGLELIELAPKGSSEPVSLPVLPFSSLPFAGVPLQSFVWAVTIAQAAMGNQTYALNSQESYCNVSSDFAMQTAFIVPGMPSASVSEVTENKCCRAYSGVCFPASTGFSQKETVSTTGVYVESGMLRSEGAPCDLDSSTTNVDDPSIGATVCGSVLASEGMDCFTMPQIAHPVTCGGYTHNGIRIGLPTNGPLQSNLYTNGRSFVTQMAAAEARRRRKELTRSKFSRRRAVRVPSSC